MRRIICLVGGIIIIFSLKSQNFGSIQLPEATKLPKFLNVEVSFSPYISENSKKISVQTLLLPGIAANYNYFTSSNTSITFGISAKRFLSIKGISLWHELADRVPAPDFSRYSNNVLSYNISVFHLNNVKESGYCLLLPFSFNYFFQEFVERYPNFYIGSGFNLIFRHYNFSATVDGVYHIHSISETFHEDFLLESIYKVSTYNAILLLSTGVIFPISNLILFDVGFEGGYGTGNTFYTSVFGRFKF